MKYDKGVRGVLFILIYNPSIALSYLDILKYTRFNTINAYNSVIAVILGVHQVAYDS